MRQHIENSNKTSDVMESLNLLTAVTRNRNFILLATTFCALLAGTVSAFLPNFYTSTATILNPAQNQLKNNLIQFLGLSNDPIGIGSAPSIIKSPHVLEKIIEQYELATVYDENDPEELLENLRKNITVVSSKDGVISISVKDTDPERAASIANALVTGLDRTLQSFASQPIKITPPPPGQNGTAAIAQQSSSIIATLTDLAFIAETSAIKNRPLVYVLDKARPPLKKSGPQRLLLSGMGALLGLFASVFVILVLEARKRAAELSSQSSFPQGV